MRSNSLVELDRAHLVHPVVSWRGHEASSVRVLTSAKGVIVTDVSYPIHKMDVENAPENDAQDFKVPEPVAETPAQH